MLSIEYKATGELIPYVNNSRTHSELQIQQVASSIKEFGFTNPILIDEEGGVIAGHGRLLAAQMMNYGDVPTITLKGLTDSQRKAYVIADNRIAMNSGWDDEMLKVELESLTESEFNLDILGWDVLPTFGAELDYSILDDDVDEEVQELTDGVKKAIMIEFEAEHYEEARELVSYWRGQEAYVGYMIMDFLRKEKDK